MKQDLLDKGWSKKRKLFQRKQQSADFRLRIDYDDIILGNKARKKKLIILTTIQSIRILSKRAKKSFNAIQLEKDILNLFHTTIYELEKSD